MLWGLLTFQETSPRLLCWSFALIKRENESWTRVQEHSITAKSSHVKDGEGLQNHEMNVTTIGISLLYAFLHTFIVVS